MRGGAIGLVMMTFILLFLATVPLFVQVDPNKQSLAAAFAPPGRDYLLGADQFGRSILVRLARGGLLSLTISFVTVALCLSTGTLLAALSSWLGGGWSLLIGSIADGIYAMPGLLIVLIVVGLFGGGIPILVLVLWLVTWPEYFRVSRTKVHQLVASDAVLASRMFGMRAFTVLRLQVIPPVLPYVLGIGCLAIGRTMMSIASLGFLGIGLAPPQAEWGMMVSELLPHADRAPVQLLAPVVAIFWTVLSFLLLGQALTETDPAHRVCDDRN